MQSRNFLEDKMTRKLHIGGQQSHPDWEIFDIQPGEDVAHVGDAQDLSLFEDETFEEVYASHILEHMDYQKVLQKALNHWSRVLKPGGKLYLSVPDMEVLCKLFLLKDMLSPEARFFIMRMLFGGHTDEYDFHSVGLYFDIVKAYLVNAGFKTINKVEEFGIFDDSSSIKYGGLFISLNVIAVK